MDRDLKFRIQKISDEGSQVPFTARIWFGIMNLRDEVFNFAGIDPESGRKVFDKDYKSVLDSLVAMRTASKNIKTLITDHRRKGELGQLVVMQRNAVEITESIDIPLMHNLSTFINSGARALKAMQPLLVKFKIEIDFLFRKETNFQKGLQQLEAVDRAVAEYISAVRTFWSERFMERRNSLEHHGWYLPNVEYRISPDSVVIIEPEVDALPVTQYTETMANKINAFVEDLVVYAFSTLLTPSIVVVEVPENERNPSLPVRFEITLAGTGRAQWSLRYDDTGFH